MTTAARVAYAFDATISSAVPVGDGDAPPPEAMLPLTNPPSARLLDRMHRYWQAANYLTVGQIYLQENALLREPLLAAHIKPRLLGHWGTSPGLSFIYVLVHAFGAAVDNPNLIVAAVVGEGEAETGPLEGSWKGISFLNPVRDGAVLPILHQAFAAALDTCIQKIRTIQQAARTSTKGFTARPRWPAIILRTPKGWTGPKEVAGLPVEGTFRAHQVPLDAVRSKPEQLEDPPEIANWVWTEQ